MFFDLIFTKKKKPESLDKIRGFGLGTGGAEEPPRPVGDEGGPQAGENTERAECSKRRQAIMFSTAGESSRGSAARLPCGVDYSASVFRVREKTEMRHVVSSILPDLLKGKERSKDRSFPLELVVRIELTTCSLRTLT